MAIFLFALTLAITLMSMGVTGYLASRRQRRRTAERMLELTSRLDHASTLIARVESISERLRCAMATHHSTLAHCHDQIQVLSDKHSDNADPAHHMHLQDAFQPTQRLSDDIAHAYDELRQHTRAFRHLQKPRRQAREE
ncbi:MAG: hypothetical protein ACQESR_24310 [Planctomycetota bacterium]